MSDVGCENLRRGCRLAGRRGTRLLCEHQARSGRDGPLLLTSLELLDRLAALVPSARVHRHHWFSVLARTAAQRKLPWRSRMAAHGRIQPDRPIVAERPLEELRGRRAGAGKQTVTH